MRALHDGVRRHCTMTTPHDHDTARSQSAVKTLSFTRILETIDGKENKRVTSARKLFAQVMSVFNEAVERRGMTTVRAHVPA